MAIHPINFEVARNIIHHLQDTKKVRKGYYGKYFKNAEEKEKQIQKEELEAFKAGLPIEAFKRNFKINEQQKRLALI